MKRPKAAGKANRTARRPAETEPWGHLRAECIYARRRLAVFKARKAPEHADMTAALAPAFATIDATPPHLPIAPEDADAIHFALNEFRILCEGANLRALSDARKVESDAREVESDAREAELLPFAEKGKRFSGGKPPGAAGPLRAVIRAMLARKGNAGLTARELWAACAALPERQRHGIDFETDDNAFVQGRGNVSFRRFANLVSEEKKRPR